MNTEAPTSTTEPSRREGGPTHAHLRRARLVWGLAALAVLVAGLGITWALASDESEAADRRDETQFADDASQVAALLRTELQRQDEFLVSAAAFAARNPEMTDEDLNWWFESVRAKDRYPNLVAVDYMRVVPADERAAYVEARGIDASDVGPRARPAASDGSTPVDGNRPAPGSSSQPDGAQRSSCFLQAVAHAVAPTDTAGGPPRGDVCANRRIRGVTEASGATGDSTFHGTAGEGLGPVRASMPVYAGGGVPDDVDERVSLHLGEVSMHVDAESLLADALVGHPELSGAVRFEDEISQVVIETEPIVDAEHTSTIELFDGWTLEIAGVDAMEDGRSAQSLAIGGVALSVLVSLLIYVLGTGRARALDLVDDATEELRHQALHDPLTGLANRALIADRLDALVARGRRRDTTPAVLFVDLDGFKEINDVHGHAVGDELLCDVAGRLTATLRDTDTVGRLGGDEFVILVDGDHSDQVVDVADRLLDTLRPPFASDHAPRDLKVTASVGIAQGARRDADDLLRDADLALYEAKAAGKDCWRILQAHRMDEEPEVGVEPTT